MKSPIIIGLIITMVSFVMTWTYIVPILTIIPSTMIEGIMVKLIGKEPYSNVGISVILVLIIASIGVSIFYFSSEAKRVKESTSFRIDLFLGYMFIQFLIIHPLVFYINWGIKLNFRGDGQLIFGIMDTFPISSLSFVGLGLITEIIRVKYKAPNIKKSRAAS